MAAAATEHPAASKVPSSVTRVYDIPVVRDTVTYADSVLKGYALSAAVLQRAEAIALTLYKTAGEPIQTRLQGQIDQLDGLANKGLDYVQGKAPYIFDAKTDELVATARKPADQAYSTAKSYQELVSSQLHNTLLASQQTLSSLNEKLATAAAIAKDHVPKNGKEAQELAKELLEQIEKAKDVIAKQSGELPAHVSKAVQPYVEKLQKGAGEVKAELAKKDVSIHQKAQHIISITREITTDSLSDAIEAVKYYVQSGKGKAQTNGTHAVESTGDFIKEHAPDGAHSYAEVVKE
jgi:uncharacterized protein (UPF0147 family)